MERIQFKSNTTSFFKELSSDVNRYLRTQKKGAYAGARFWIKTIFLGAIVSCAYAGILCSCNCFMLFACYMALGIGLLLVAFNVAHDASHNSISKSKKVNYILYYASFMLQGVNGYLWRKRHVEEHHPYPNIPHRDPDLINTKFLRYSQSQPHKPYHRWQIYYALPLYAVYTLYWLFVKDFTRKGNALDIKKFKKQAVINIIHKLTYLFLFLGLPFLTGTFTSCTYLLCFLFMHFTVSILLVFTFTLSHYISGQPEAEIQNSILQNSWEMHQVVSSVDFHTQSKLALFVFGGFNCHIAHHLFPHVSHVHYPALSKITRKHLASYNIPMREVRFMQGIKLHFRLLREMGRREF
jgi:linoleoyl-CoA desaturase